MIFHLMYWTLIALPAYSQEMVERPDLVKHFQQFKVVGAFALYSPLENRLILINSKRAKTRFLPASTFKVANSLIALETGVIKDESEIIPYGGQPQRQKAWEKDMSLRQAIKVSNVPVYQEIARRVGKGAYQDWLERLDYGNKAMGRDVTRFWLDGSLKISAVEQVRFLARLANGQLSASKASQSTVSDIIRQKTNGAIELYGKTGWGVTSDADIGWFVGWVKDGAAIHAFAFNMDIKKRSDARLRRPLALRLLRELDVY